MSDLSNEWKIKYPTAKHAPDPNCKRCKGVGFYVRKEINARGNIIPPAETPCICIFVDHDAADWIAKLLAESARKLLDEMESE